MSDEVVEEPGWVGWMLSAQLAGSVTQRLSNSPTQTQAVVRTGTGRGSVLQNQSVLEESHPHLSPTPAGLRTECNALTENVSITDTQQHSVLTCSVLIFLMFHKYLWRSALSWGSDRITDELSQCKLGQQPEVTSAMPNPVWKETEKICNRCNKFT